MAEYRSSSTPPAEAASGVQLKLSDNGAVRPPVEIRSSTRRRKTATAFYEGERIVVLVPARLSRKERDDLAEKLVNRLVNRSSRAVGSDSALERRATELSDRYLGGVRPSSIRWADNQQRRWGSCTLATGAIRISTRLQPAPKWVLDAVIVHEVAHLLEGSHSPAFYRLVGRYPRLAEADAYLLGYSLGLCSGDGSRGVLPLAEDGEHCRGAESGGPGSGDAEGGDADAGDAETGGAENPSPERTSPDSRSAKGAGAKDGWAC